MGVLTQHRVGSLIFVNSVRDARIILQAASRYMKFFSLLHL